MSILVALTLVLAPRKFMKFRYIALLVLVVFGVSTHGIRAENLKIGYGAFSLGYALIWITKEGRLFDKNGLDVEVLYLESDLVRTVLISRDIPIGGMSGPRSSLRLISRASVSALQASDYWRSGRPVWWSRSSA
jgi:ABC-type nitrate/sulfonate/bicarbonate transport system substrate-binding protein